MASSHQKASRKDKKAPAQHKPRGRPRSGPTKRVLLKMPPPPDNNQDEDDLDGEGEEDELYGRRVTDDDGSDDAAVIQKPRTYHKNRTGGEDEPRGTQVQ